MSINERDAAIELRKLGFKSVWGCSDGVFIDSDDVFKIIRNIKRMNSTTLSNVTGADSSIKKADDKIFGLLGSVEELEKEISKNEVG